MAFFHHSAGNMFICIWTHPPPVKCFYCEAAAVVSVRFAFAITWYRFFFWGCEDRHSVNNTADMETVILSLMHHELSNHRVMSYGDGWWLNTFVSLKIFEILTLTTNSRDTTEHYHSANKSKNKCENCSQEFKHRIRMKCNSLLVFICSHNAMDVSGTRALQKYNLSNPHLTPFTAVAAVTARRINIRNNTKNIDLLNKNSQKWMHCRWEYCICLCVFRQIADPWILYMQTGQRTAKKNYPHFYILHVFSSHLSLM